MDVYIVIEKCFWERDHQFPELLRINLISDFSGIPPSQGGRYEGFGNAPVPTSQPSQGSAYDDAMKVLINVSIPSNLLLF